MTDSTITLAEFVEWKRERGLVDCETPRASGTTICIAQFDKPCCRECVKRSNGK